MPFYGYRAYMPVTAYTVDIPVLVNGVNINTSQFPALNFKPAGEQYAYIYVPASEFTKVGASVYWDNAAQHMVITSPYYKETMAAMQKDINMLIADSDSQKINDSNYANFKKTTRVTNLTDKEIQFDAAPAVFSGYYMGLFTIGQNYPYFPSSASGGQRGIIVKDNFGVWQTFGYHIPLP